MSPLAFGIIIFLFLIACTAMKKDIENQKRIEELETEIGRYKDHLDDEEDDDYYEEDEDKIYR